MNSTMACIKNSSSFIWALASNMSGNIPTTNYVHCPSIWQECFYFAGNGRQLFSVHYFGNHHSCHPELAQRSYLKESFFWGLSDYQQRSSTATYCRCKIALGILSYTSLYLSWNCFDDDNIIAVWRGFQCMRRYTNTDVEDWCTVFLLLH